MVSKENKDQEDAVSPSSLRGPISQGEPLKGRGSPKSQVTALEDETKRLLGRRSGTIERAFGHTPSLEEFKSTSFSDYVRGTILGVDLDDSNSGNNELRTTELSQPLDTQTAQTNTAKQKPGNGESASDSKASSPGGSVTKQSPPSMVTRSQRRKAACAILQPDTTKAAISTKPTPPRKRDGPRKICPYRFSDGVAKVTPPRGWWDLSGVGKDLTMRGPAWQEGTRLGDMVISDPIKQCASGIGGVYDYTMLELPAITVSEFGKKADKYRKSQVGSEFDEDTSDEFIDGLARKFWRRLGPTMEASMYGADMEGTLFQGADACGWNVDRLESCLQLLKADVDDGSSNDDSLSLPGVTTAYLYVGMWASVFAAHTEDMNLLSINYLHAGAPKYWYSIDPEDSQRFESLAASHFGSAASACPEFLRHKRYLVSPTLLKKAGIQFRTLIQRAGDVVITFPGAYHFGFNTGFNMAESTNFAVPEWIPFGETARVCMCHPHSVRIDMNRFKVLFNAYEDDMMKAHKKGGSSGMTYSEWVKQERTKRRKMKTQEEQKDSDHEDNLLSDPALPKVSYNKGMVVEVMKLAPRGSSSSDASKKKSTKAKKKKEVEHWRLALKVKAATFTPQTPVICYVSCEVGEKGVRQKTGEENKFFCGTIKQVVEGHARIHFAGTGRKEDIWIATNSPRLFLDGGPEDPPSSEKDGKKTGKRSVEPPRSPKKKVRAP
uniref:JmjC domain-containing protein n=1 Tax=Helicotheca tamesis TaxID=374047 RepID=A0A7S2N1K5_9STRA|mmetsp:Transcript_7934/g.10924  ORF Transcript_7934/g.10924 Transcript_7934/m.10924 type:complete len:719 (+) Transcript_7934:69-2225(+)